MRWRDLLLLQLNTLQTWFFLLTWRACLIWKYRWLMFRCNLFPEITSIWLWTFPRWFACLAKTLGRWGYWHHVANACRLLSRNVVRVNCRFGGWLSDFTADTACMVVIQNCLTLSVMSACSSYLCIKKETGPFPTTLWFYWIESLRLRVVRCMHGVMDRIARITNITTSAN